MMFFRLFFCAFICLFLVSCGYKPSAVLAKNVIGEKVYIDVDMSRLDPQNTVLIQDAVASAFVDRFGSRLVQKQDADTLLNVRLGSVRFTPLAYDNNGYVISYRAIATLLVDYKLHSGEKGNLRSSGDYDFPIQANSVISDTRRFEAIRYASVDAIDEFIAILTMRGLRQENR